MELEWLKKSLSCSAARELRKLVDHYHPELSIIRQCALLGLPRSTLYYRPAPVRESTLSIWKNHAADVPPFAGPVLLRAGGSSGRFPMVEDLQGRTPLER